MDYFRWILGLALAICSLFLIVMNAAIFIAGITKRKSSSWVPIVGGALGAAALLLLPIEGAHRWWWIPFIADPGSAIGMLWTVIFYIFKWPELEPPKSGEGG